MADLSTPNTSAEADARAPVADETANAPSKQRAAILPAPLRNAIARVTRLALTGAAIVVAAAIGQVSAQMFVARGSFLNVDQYGPWQHWRNQGQANTDPYTRAHAVTSGTIRLSSNVAGIFEAHVDPDGARLHSSCDYIVEGPNTDGLWWSLAVFDSEGTLIENEAQRHAFTSDTAATNPNGTFTITLGRDARPGNWLPTGGAGRIILVFTLLDPATGLSPEARASRYLYLPKITSEGCS